MADSSRGSSSPVRLGLVGVGGFARQTIDLLAECPDVEVAAVADINREAAEQVGRRFGARTFVDVRSMIVESPRHAGVEAVVMSLPHQAYPEYVRLAAEQGLHLLKEKPLARSFDEALSLVDAYESGPARGKVFMIATQRRFHPGFAAMRERLSRAGRPFLVRSHFLFNWSGEFGWRGDKSKAGFGAFGDAGYHNIDLLTWLVGVPEEVFALQSGRGREKPLHPYDTDDTGTCLLHYRSGLMGYIVCSWVTQPTVLDLAIHGTRGVLTATPERFEMLDLSGKVVEELSVERPQMARQTVLAKMAAFVSAIRSGRKTYSCSARENLLNQAVVEAAYLSGRTGQAQLPARVFELRGRRMEDYLPRREVEGGAGRHGRRR